MLLIGTLITASRKEGHTGPSRGAQTGLIAALWTRWCPGGPGDQWSVAGRSMDGLLAFMGNLHFFHSFLVLSVFEPQAAVVRWIPRLPESGICSDRLFARFLFKGFLFPSLATPASPAKSSNHFAGPPAKRPSTRFLFATACSSLIKSGVPPCVSCNSKLISSEPHSIHFEFAGTPQAHTPGVPSQNCSFIGPLGASPALPSRGYFPPWTPFWISRTPEGRKSAGFSRDPPLFSLIGSSEGRWSAFHGPEGSVAAPCSGPRCLGFSSPGPFLGCPRNSEDACSFPVTTESAIDSFLRWTFRNATIKK